MNISTISDYNVASNASADIPCHLPARSCHYRLPYKYIFQNNIASYAFRIVVLLAVT